MRCMKLADLVVTNEVPTEEPGTGHSSFTHSTEKEKGNFGSANNFI